MTQFVEERYACPECRVAYTVWRPQNQLREKKHKKWLYCPVCNTEKNCIKVEEGE